MSTDKSYFVFIKKLIALGIKRANPDFEILGSDRENIQEIAQKRGIIDSKVSLVEGAQKADIIILAVPIITTLELLKKLATLNLKKGLLITCSHDQSQEFQNQD